MRSFTSPVEAARWLRSRVPGTLCSDSRRLRAGDGFLAWPGAASDARSHVREVLARGAAACLVEQTGVAAYSFADERVASFEQLKTASGPLAAAYFDSPSAQLAVVAITGTNGKTSSAWWLAQALSCLKHPPMPCGLVGTLGIGQVPLAEGDSSALQPSGLTTPDAVLLQQSFRQFVQVGLKACAIEASSIGLAEGRLAGTHIRSAIFTNFTQDHLDYHGSMAQYWEAKAALFRWPGLSSAVINIDDAHGASLALEVAHRVPDVWTVSCQQAARLQACDIKQGAAGLEFVVCEGQQRHSVATALIGHYNLANLLGVMAAMRALGVPLAEVASVCASLGPVPGRMQRVNSAAGALAVVDYAHTPDALAKALQALRGLADARGGRLWCLFGCGGDRDSAKRPLMGAMAEQHADQVLLTSDNPRSESPQAIIAQIAAGVSQPSRLLVEPDRARAIAQALGAAGAHDVVLIAGKGHELYQEVCGQRLAFSDVQQVLLARPRQTASVQGQA
ncbi:MAG: UDP-N-acetylmuramoyl-L-alanyl-D-glutamate--2,6-diaminopimelate ligase [Rhodoferax sp.]|nr:UDP-N-acetylmuramoyl-L-alanyl-D-glutamate--2,6-diaminopimelate ligase [Rhodoferax sp.]